MKCEEAQKELSVRPLESARQPIQDHVAGCEACQAWLTDVQALEARLRSWRADSPPQTLETRIAAAIDSPERSSRKNYLSLWKENPTMRRLSFAAALAVAVICALFFFMNGKAASAFGRMELAVSKVQNAHMIVWYNVAKTGPVNIQKVEEIWYQGNCWRKRYGNRTDNDRIIRGSTYYVFDPAQGKVVSSPESADQTINFSLPALAEGYMPTGAQPQAQLIGTSIENGKSVQEIDLDLSSSGERMLFWVDAATGLPMRAEKQDLDYSTGQWNINGRFEFEFNQNLPASLFDPQSLAPNL